MAKTIQKEKLGKKALNPKQKYFCELYASEREFFGNGVESYIEAYNPKRIGNWYKSAVASASRLLTNVNILLYINELLESKGLNNEFVDKQLAFLITQNADFRSKLGAIKEYNQLRSRIKKYIDVTSAGKRIEQKVRTDPILKRAVEFYEAKLKKEYQRRNRSRQPSGLDQRKKNKKRKRRSD